MNQNINLKVKTHAKPVAKEILHYPTLKTIFMVEEVLKNADKVMSKEQIKRKLEGKLMHQTLNVILDYLEESGKIIIGKKGILWTFNPSKKLERAIARGVEV